MKRRFLKFRVTCCCVALFTAAVVYAQIPVPNLRVTIPFDFNVRGKTLPAGDYQIKRLSDGPDGLIISGVRNHKHEIFETVPVESRETLNRGEIVFHRYGNNYFLSEIFSTGESEGCMLPESRDERSVRRDMASNGNEAKSEIVALAVN